MTIRLKSQGGGGNGNGIQIYLTVAAAEAGTGVDNNTGYVVENETLYRYEDSAASYIRDGTFVLNTGDGGNTRWLATAGRYVYADLNVAGGIVGFVESRSGVIANGYSVRANNHVESGGGTITNSVGLCTEEITVGDNNVNCLLGTTTVPAGDWNLYSASVRNSYFNGPVEINNKLTVAGLIDPTGLVLDEQAAVPGGTPAAGKGTIWTRTTDSAVVFTDSSGSTYILNGVVGPATSTDDALAVYDGTTGDLLKDGVVPIEQYITAPAGPTSAGIKGQRAYSANYIYECVATNVWVRYAAISTW
jgi:hypothetical protein